jgi:hypothetical protein
MELEENNIKDAATVRKQGNQVCWDCFLEVLALKWNKRKLSDNRNTYDCLN